MSDVAGAVLLVLVPEAFGQQDFNILVERVAPCFVGNDKQGGQRRNTRHGFVHV